MKAILVLFYQLILWIVYTKFSLCQLQILSPSVVNTKFQDGQVIVDCLNCEKLLDVINLKGSMYFVNGCEDKEEQLVFDTLPFALIDVSKSEAWNYEKSHCFKSLRHHIIYLENKGFKMIIISMDSTSWSNWEYGSSNIMIPVLSVKKTEDFNILKEYVINNPLVQNKVYAQVNEKLLFSDKINIDVYTFSGKELGFVYNSLNLFKDEFNSREIQINTNYLTYPPQLELNPSNCICSGKYCTRFYENATKVFTSNLYQNCVQYYSEEIGSPLIFLDYMNKYLFHNNSTKNVPIEIIQQMNLNLEKINNCVSNSFTPKLDDITLCTSQHNIPILEKNKAQNSTDYFMNPYLYINNMQIFNYPTENFMKDYICAIFAKKSVKACNAKVFDTNENSGFKWILLLVIILVVVLVNLIIVFLCKRYTNKRLQERIDDIQISTKVGQIMTNYKQFK